MTSSTIIKAGSKSALSNTNNLVKEGGMESNVFLVKHKEKELLNQYWYSRSTIVFLLAEIATQGKKAAFLSTPSVYFSLQDPTLKAASRVFDVPWLLLIYNRLTRDLRATLGLSITISICQRTCRRSASNISILFSWTRLLSLMMCCSRYNSFSTQ